MQSARFFIKWTVEQIWNSSNFVEKYLKECMHAGCQLLHPSTFFLPRSLPRSSCWSDSAFWSCDEDYIHRNHLMLIIITMPWSLPYSMINIDNMKRALTIGWWQQTATLGKKLAMFGNSLTTTYIVIISCWLSSPCLGYYRTVGWIHRNGITTLPLERRW